MSVLSRNKRLTAARIVPIKSKRRSLDAAPSFLRKYGPVLMPAYKLILKNYKRLSRGEVIREGGFTFSVFTTGSVKGDFNRLALRVDHAGKSFFVKLGKHTSPEISSAYSLAREHLFKINHKIDEFNVRLVNYRLVYNPKESFEYKGAHRGVLVSDFMDSSEVTMLADLKKKMGREWESSPIALAHMKLREELQSKGILDAALKNTFYNPKTKTFFLFDLKTNGGES